MERRESDRDNREPREPARPKERRDATSKRITERRRQQHDRGGPEQCRDQGPQRKHGERHSKHARHDVQREARAGKKSAADDGACRVPVEPGAHVAERVVLQPAGRPRPREGGSAEETSDGPQPDVANEDAERARDNARGDADLAALNEQPGGNARQILRSEGAESNREECQHGTTAADDAVIASPASDSYSRSIARDVTSIVVRLTVAASCRAI